MDQGNLIDQTRLDFMEPEEDILDSALNRRAGVDDEITESDSSEIKEPFDPSKIRISQLVMNIESLIQRLEYGEIDLQPDFQRKQGIWNIEKQSRLIESLLIRIPIPNFYMDATDESKWVVIDGLQRLITLKRFVLEQSFTLKSLEFLRDFEGKTYDELARPFQRRIRETQVTVYLVETGTPDEVKRNIFRRINTGGVPLSGQEIRNALYPEQNTRDLLERLAQTDEFNTATNRSLNPVRMEDQECVLRFLGFYLLEDYRAYGSELDQFLVDTIEKLNTKSERELKSLESEFKRAMIAAHRIFGEYAFRKQTKLSGRRATISKPLFEVWSYHLSRLTDIQIDVLADCSNSLLDGLVRLLNEDKEFWTAISYGTGDTKRVKYRFSTIEKLIQEVLDANPHTDK